MHFATVVTGVPTGSLAAFLLWWFSLSLGATAAVSLVYALTRRLLPLGALLELSLVFPDEAPSRFRLALQSGTVESLEERLRSLQAAGEAPSAQEAAEILLRLVAALDVNDRITRGHAERVRAYAAGIGRQLGLPGDALDCLNWAALLHDIGKLEVSAEILNKQGRPTDEEWELLRVHPLHGETLVAPLEEWLGEWSAAVGYHHERWDGTGYPRGVGGEAIPLAGRVVAIADVYDVITSARSYKQPASAAEARSELVRCSGTQFDPRLVRAFVSISLSRMRFVLGPLSWLTHTPMLARFPLTQSSATAFGGLAALSAAAMLGVTTPNGTALAASPSAVRPTPLAGSRGANGAQPARIGTQASPRQIPRGGKPARGPRAGARPSAQAPTSEPGPAVSAHPGTGLSRSSATAPTREPVG